MDFDKYGQFPISRRPHGNSRCVLLGNSAKSGVTNPFLVEDLTNIPTTLNLTTSTKAKVFTDPNQLQSWFDRIRGASLGAEQDKLF
jgi:hypothetical protein